MTATSSEREWDRYAGPRHSDVVTQARVESEIMRLSALLEDRNDAIASAAERAAHADVAYRRMHAGAILQAEGRNAEQREAWAHLQVLDEYYERKMAESSLLAAQESARSLRAQLSALQSLAANIRALVS